MRGNRIQIASNGDGYAHVVAVGAVTIRSLTPVLCGERVPSPSAREPSDLLCIECFEALTGTRVDSTPKQPIDPGVDDG